MMRSSNPSPGTRSRLLREAPLAAGALIVAELFFHWGSFTLELVGFLATWAALSFVARSLLEVATRPGRTRLRSGQSST